MTTIDQKALKLAIDAVTARMEEIVRTRSFEGSDLVETSIKSYLSALPAEPAPAKPNDEELKRAIAQKLHDVMDRPTNWGITPYSLLAEEVLSTIRQHDAGTGAGV